MIIEPCGLHVRELLAEGVQGGGGDNVRWEVVPNRDGQAICMGHWTIQWNIPPRMEPTCLSGGWHQPPLPGIPRRRMCNSVHHM